MLGERYKRQRGVCVCVCVCVCVSFMNPKSSWEDVYMRPARSQSVWPTNATQPDGISDVPHCCDQIPAKSRLRRSPFGSEPEGAASPSCWGRHGHRAWGSWSRWICPQEAERGRLGLSSVSPFCAAWDHLVLAYVHPSPPILLI